MKCIVKDCSNHKDQGKFVGDLCAPCNRFITTGEGKFSQMYRNTVMRERAACEIIQYELLKSHVDFNTLEEHKAYISAVHLYANEIKDRSKR